MHVSKAKLTRARCPIGLRAPKLAEDRLTPWVTQVLGFGLPVWERWPAGLSLPGKFLAYFPRNSLKTDI